ncbi:MAG TPA: pyridoxamine 5'-phosphate oxidase [Nocardioides sp.]|nr:pyridoxamine 5'-phosphate oxidase [Nocardioides sp.]
MDLAALRAEYALGGLHESELAPDPTTMFRGWIAEAAASGMHEPNAMVLATVSAEGVPSSRMVLLKGVDETGFRFFTNLRSRKGSELGANPRCSLLFPWHPLERQIRIDGVAEELPREDVAAYFATRPRGAQLGAWASRQSSTVSSREELDEAFAAVEARFPDEVPLPDWWGGYAVVPDAVEFWQGRPGRMHDRLVYRRTGTGWTTSRLAP